MVSGKNRIIIGFFILCSIVFLSGCLFSGPIDTGPVSIEIDESSVQFEYDINEIDLTSIKLILHYKDESPVNISIMEEYISESDLALLEEVGIHTITVTYNGKTTQLTLNMVDKSTRTYTVTFDGNGGILISGDVVQNVLYNTDATPPIFEKEGFLLDGWSISFTDIQENVTIIANWVIKTYTVTFEGNGGELISGSDIQTIEHGSSAEEPSFVRDGYQFIGWNAEFNNITSDITITALWGAEGPIYTLKDDNTYEFTGYNGNPTEVYIPATYDGKRISSIADNALSEKSNLTLVSIGANVRNIGEHVFANCEKLHEIYIAVEGPILINENAFSGIDPFFRFYAFSPLVSYFKDHLSTLSNHVFTHPGIHIVSFSNNGGTLIEGEDVQFIIHGKTAVFPTYELEGYHLYWDESPVIYEDKTIQAKWTDITPSTSGCIFGLKLDGTYQLNKYLGVETTVFIASHHQGIPITSIGPQAFAGQAITSLTISEGIQYIQTEAFAFCSSLSTIEFPSTLQEVEANAFLDSLWYLNQPDGLIVIGKTLYDYKGTIPDGYTVGLPNGIHYITDFAFADQPNLTSLNLPEGLKKINNNAFENCTNLSTINFPATLEAIGTDAFENTNWLSNQDEGLVYAGSVVLTYNGYILGDSTITIADGTKGIANNAFRYQYSLESINLPDSIVVIGDYAFAYCEELPQIILPNSIKSIGSFAFLNCKKITNITLPAELENLGENAFSNCSSLESIVIPDGVRSIGYQTFHQCSSLETVTLGAQTIEISERAFYEATNLSNIVFNDQLERIGKNAFSITNIKEFILPDSLVIIEDYALSNGVAEKIYIGKNLQYFNLNNAKHEIMVSSENPFYSSVDGILYSKNGKNLICYPYDKTSNIIIPDGTETVLTNALTTQTNIENIYFPESISIIEEYAIANCANLISVSIANPNAPLLKNYNFIESNNDWLLYVPIDSSPNYADWLVETARIKTILLSCSVLFDIQGGTVIEGEVAQSVQHGKGAVAPVVEKAGYALTWDRSFDYIVESIVTVKAIWTLLIEVNFDPFGGTLVSGNLQQQVPLGSAAIAPVLEMENFTFAGWDQSFDNITQQITITALWEFSLFKWRINSDMDGIIITGLQPNYQEEHLVVESSYQFLSVTGIDAEAFKNATFIKSATIAKNIKDIGYNIFMGCTSLEEITLPFKYGPNDPGNLQPMAYLAYYFNEIPSSLKRVTVQEGITRIPAWMFNDCQHIEGIVLPDTITHIEKNAFMNCFELVSVTLPDSLEQIADEAFRSCYKLSAITLPSGLKGLGYGVFQDNSSLISIVLPNQITVIGNKLFAGCSKLQEVIFSNQITSIGVEAFSGCSKLVEVGLPSNLLDLKQKAFYGCSELQEVIFPDTLTSIGEETFSGCIKLHDFVFPASLAVIGGLAFNGCQSIQNINLPASLTAIGAYAFSGCIAITGFTVEESNPNFSSMDGILYNKLQTHIYRAPGQLTGSLTVPSTVTTLANGAFENCREITHIVLPDDITNIPFDAFRNCSNLISINIPLNCQIIRERAFYLCSSLIEITFPIKVNDIESQAFAGCSELKQVYSIRETAPNLNQTAFTECHSDLKIEVRSSYYQSYYNAWKNKGIQIYIIEPYYVQFNLDGGILVSGSYQYYIYDGSELQEPVTQKEGYTFIGWDTPFDEIASDVTIKALWEIKTFIVTFNSNDGTLLSGNLEQIVEYGGSAVAPNCEKVGYYLQWDKNFNRITEDITINAIWTIKILSVNFKGDKGTLVSGEEYQTITYGESAVAPVYAASGYRFVGWSHEVDNITENVIITALWEIITYTVTFDGDGGVLISGEAVQTIEHGQMAIAPVFEKEGHKFSYWIGNFNAIYSDKTIKAFWIAESYFITFDGNGGTLTNGSVSITYTLPYGVTVTTPSFTRENYHIVGWTPELETVKKDITYYAVWEINTYIVQFDGGGGTLTNGEEMQEVVWQEDAVPPVYTREGYEFIGWSDSTDHIYSDRLITAQWEILKYTVMFDGNGGSFVSGLPSQTIDYGKDAILPVCEKEGFAFVGWSEPVTNIINDVITIALWKVLTYTITFDGGDGILISGEEIQTVNYGENAIPPVYEKEGYEISCWSEFFTNVKSDLTVTANWQILTYTVIFDGNDGILISGEEIQTVNYGENAIAPVFEKEGYEFLGWSEVFTNVKSDLTVTANWQILTYTVIFDGDEGILISGEEIQTVNYGENAIPPVYEKEGYEIFGWSESFNHVKNDITTTALWKEVFTVVFNPNSGTLISGDLSQSILYDDSAIAPILEKDGFIFAGWDQSLENITKNTEFTAQWQLALGYRIVNEEIYITNIDVNYTNKVLTIPDLIEGKPVVYIESSAFKYNNVIEYLIIGDNVYDIDVNAFSFMSNLNTVTFGKNVETINGAAFQFCQSLETIYFKNKINNLNFGVFYNCHKIKEVYIGATTPPEVEIFGNYSLFYNNDINLIPEDFRIYVPENSISAYQNAPSWSVFTDYIVPHSNTYTVTFDGAGGTLISGEESHSVLYGSSAIPPVYVKEGYVLEKYDIDYEVITSDRIITARWLKTYNVTFAGDGGTLISGDEMQTIVEGNSAVPPLYEKEHYELVGWSQSFENINSDITITALWTINQYSIAFVSNGGTDVDTITQDYNTAVSAPSAPTKEGYSFSGWYEDSELSNPYTFTTMPSESITLYAKWTINQYSIAFVSNGGTDVDTITQDYSTAVSTPSAPTKEGYSFSGWYEDSELSNPYTFTTMPSESITLYAKWIYNFTYTISNGEVTITSYIGTDSEVIIPSMIEGLPVKTIGASAFYYNTNFTSVVIPEGIVTIEQFAFHSTSLTSFTIPSTTTFCDISNFGISTLSNINVETDNLTYTSVNGVLYSKDKTILIRFPTNKDDTPDFTGVIHIENSAFSETGFENLIIPEGVLTIGDSSFFGCSNLTSITLPSTLQSIGSSAFMLCSKLASIILPEGITNIGSQTFYLCSNLNTVTLPSTLQVIERYVFANTSLTSITIPASVTSIGYYAFAQCYSLENIILSESITIINNYTFLDCINLNNISIPDSVTSIGEFAFGFCSSLTSINIPDSVTFIGYRAFHLCNELTEIYIPLSVTEISELAFSSCSKLTIYTDYLSKPDEWDTDWNPDNRPVVWGYEE
ncbi:MAG: leucine-rich repeat protein [Bacilli bacterium]|nr:leucine-rich repeat protein [Bacilli bacterium]